MANVTCANVAKQANGNVTLLRPCALRRQIEKVPQRRLSLMSAMKNAWHSTFTHGKAKDRRRAALNDMNALRLQLRHKEPIPSVSWAEIDLYKYPSSCTELEQRFPQLHLLSGKA